MAHRVRLLSLRSIGRLGMAGAMVLAVAQGASAEDGLQQWLSSVFGGGASAPSAAAMPQAGPPVAGQRARRFHSFRVRYEERVRHDAPEDDRGDRFRSIQRPRRWIRPLVVQLRRPAPASSTAQIPAKAAVVTIFTDRTLRRGDAVMMADGVRVFAGSASWPYAKSDFVTVADAKHLSRSTTKVLADLDLLPRG